MPEPEEPEQRERETMRCPHCKQDYDVGDFEAVMYHASQHDAPKSTEHSETAP
jgi:hypothetical protein